MIEDDKCGKQKMLHMYDRQIYWEKMFEYIQAWTQNHFVKLSLTFPYFPNFLPLILCYITNNFYF